MVLKGDWTGVQGFFGTSEILRRIEFSPPPPQRLGGQQQQLVKRLEGWWVQVRRIADGWMGGSGSHWQPPTTRKTRKLTAAAQRASLSMLCQQPLSVLSFFWPNVDLHFPKHILQANPKRSRGLQIPLLLYWVFHRLILSCRDLSNRPVCHAQVQSRWRENQYQPGQ